MYLTLTGAIVLAVLLILCGVAYSRFRTIGTDMSVWEFFSRLIRGSRFGNISPVRLDARLPYLTEEMVLVDLRETERFERGHIEGAISRPFDDFLREVVVEERYEKDQELILICDTGHMSRVAADLLVQDEGYSNVINVTGGMKAWEKYEQSLRDVRCCSICACRWPA